MRKIMLQALLWPALLLVASMAFLNACGNEGEEPAATVDPSVLRGSNIFQVHCAACHAVEGDVVIVGPSLSGIGSRAGQRQAGMNAEAYLQTSILRPADYIVPGFMDTMPSDFGKKLRGDQLDALVAYLMSLK